MRKRSGKKLTDFNKRLIQRRNNNYYTVNIAYEPEFMLDDIIDPVYDEDDNDYNGHDDIRVIGIRYRSISAQIMPTMIRPRYNTVEIFKRHI